MIVGLVQITAMLLLASPQDAPLVVQRGLDGADLAAEGIEAEVIGLPPTLGAAEFAAQVVDAEHLKSWDSGPMTEGVAIGPLNYKALTAGDGRGVVVYYSSDPDGPRAVCRLRSRQGSPTKARERALRWCAGQVGVLFPEEPAARWRPG